jgi:hypothetical protein
MALGKEAEITIQNEMIQGVWLSLICAGTVMAVLSWLLAESTIQQE